MLTSGRYRVYIPSALTGYISPVCPPLPYGLQPRCARHGRSGKKQATGPALREPGGFRVYTVTFAIMRAEQKSG